MKVAWLLVVFKLKLDQSAVSKVTHVWQKKKKESFFQFLSLQIKGHYIIKNNNNTN